MPTSPEQPPLGAEGQLRERIVTVGELFGWRRRPQRVGLGPGGRLDLRNRADSGTMDIATPVTTPQVRVKPLGHDVLSPVAAAAQGAGPTWRSPFVDNPPPSDAQDLRCSAARGLGCGVICTAATEEVKPINAVVIRAPWQGRAELT